MLQSMPDPNPRSANPTRELMRNVLAELLIRLQVSHESSSIAQALSDASIYTDDNTADALAMTLMRAGTAIGVRLAPVELTKKDVWELLLDDFPVAMIDYHPTGQSVAHVFSNVAGGRIESTSFEARGKQSDSLTRAQMNSLIAKATYPTFFIAEPSLSCESLSSNHDQQEEHFSKVDDDHHDGHHHNRLPPLQRWMRLLKLDSRDIWTLGIFTLVVSILDLATPLAVEQMVTTIGFASVIQPLIWIAVTLFAILTLSAVIKALQLFVVEILQRRMMVRIVGDLAERLPRLDRSALDGAHGPEMANRFFDVMTLQKASAAVLIDFLALTIQTITGLLLLAIYSPYLLAFDIVLLMCMTLMILLLGRGAVRTAIEESLIKYRIAHWLEDIIGNPNAFQVHGGGELAVDRANRMVVEYLGARRKHFVVLIRQSLFALLLYAVSISALLSLGGWLVLNEGISIGQLVASVSVVAVVVGAFAKIGKTLESYYDLMSATDKVGHLIDLPTVPPSRAIDAGIGPVELRFRNLIVGSGHHHVTVPEVKIGQGERVALIGEGRCGKTTVLETLAGIRSPHSGLAEIGGIDSRDVNRFAEGSMVGIAADTEIFHGSIEESVTLHRLSIQQDDLREALQITELWDDILAMPKGLETKLQTDGFPLSHSQTARLMLARAVVSRPRLLLIDGTLDRLPVAMRHRIWQTLSAARQPWTLIVITNDADIVQECSQRIDLSGHSGHPTHHPH
jgi:putative ABC transport system ATP-binding protein